VSYVKAKGKLSELGVSTFKGLEKGSPQLAESQKKLLLDGCPWATCQAVSA
jgi:hypothetical protein